MKADIFVYHIEKVLSTVGVKSKCSYICVVIIHFKLVKLWKKTDRKVKDNKTRNNNMHHPKPWKDWIGALAAV